MRRLSGRCDARTDILTRDVRNAGATFRKSFRNASDYNRLDSLAWGRYFLARTPELLEIPSGCRPRLFFVHGRESCNKHVRDVELTRKGLDL